MEIRVRVEDERAVAAFERAPEVMLRHVLAGTEQGAQYVARAARQAAPKRMTTLTNSIHVRALRSLEPDVVGHEAAVGVAYGPHVELGTGPAVGQPRYYPNPEALEDYIRSTPSVRGFAWARGDLQRSGQALSVWLRAKAWAWAIYMRGTRPQAFMGPAVVASDARVRQVLRQAVDAGVREVFAGGGDGGA